MTNHRGEGLVNSVKMWQLLKFHYLLQLPFLFRSSEGVVAFILTILEFHYPISCMQTKLLLNVVSYFMVR